jgi:hypothetical protein
LQYHLVLQPTPLLEHILGLHHQLYHQFLLFVLVVGVVATKTHLVLVVEAVVVSDIKIIYL